MFSLAVFLRYLFYAHVHEHALAEPSRLCCFLDILDILAELLRGLFMASSIDQKRASRDPGIEH